MDHRLFSIVTALLTVCLLVVGVSVLLVVAGPEEGTGASSTIFYVDDAVCPATGSGTKIEPYCRIQDAVDVAEDGDEVRVAGGIYTGTQTVTDSHTGYTFTQVVFIEKDVTLRGGYDAGNWDAGASASSHPVVIDAQRGGRPISIVGWRDSAALSVTIDGFTITGGDYTGLGNPPGGGWQVCHEDEGIDCGGGLYATWSNVLLRNSIISDNIAGLSDESHGGGIYVYLVPSGGSGVRIEKSLVANNSAPATGGQGGGIFVDGLHSPLTITTSTIQDNVAHGRGGGMRLYNMSRAQVRVEETDFIGNVSQSYLGGGAFIPMSTDGDTLSMDRVRFQDNEADGAGAALWLEVSGRYEPRARLTNLLFTGNRSDSGSVVYAHSSSQRLEIEMAHVTAAENEAPRFLHTLAWGSDRWLTATLTNTLIVSAEVAFRADEFGGGQTLLQHTNTLTEDVTTLHQTAGGEPTFEAINPLGGEAGLDSSGHLGPRSDAIDAGVDAGVIVDIDGDLRPSLDGFDIGADEFTTYLIYLPLVQRGR